MDGLARWCAGGVATLFLASAGGCARESGDLGYDDEDVERLVSVALDRLAGTGQVEVTG